ncbi:carboxymuconolactone decarboxylase family protein [Oceaniserpentilla sp. 4NH20-0058]|uniref:carboxymuconolactone decarboxylase family protein n=1 Tax=Oceaniserpentilla sp. 4NH20-0058 TaxID=3127660 RepID=UPI003109DE3E
MSSRINYYQQAPEAINLLVEQESYLSNQFSSDKILNLNILELVKLRVSQINQCAFCIDMHYDKAIELGEPPERLYGLNAWRDMPFYSPQEQLALEWAEHLTAGKPVDDALYDRAVTGFKEQGMVNLTIAINAINSWNRIGKVFKPKLGSYKAS